MMKNNTRIENTAATGRCRCKYKYKYLNLPQQNRWIGIYTYLLCIIFVASGIPSLLAFTTTITATSTTTSARTRSNFINYSLTSTLTSTLTSVLTSKSPRSLNHSVRIFAQSQTDDVKEKEKAAVKEEPETQTQTQTEPKITGEDVGAFETIASLTATTLYQR
jgi:hypothetical protein